MNVCGQCGKATDVGDWCSMQCFRDWQALRSLPLSQEDLTLADLRGQSGRMVGWQSHI